MVVNKEISGDTYKNLIDYAYNKCNYILVKYYIDQHPKNGKEMMDIILSTPGFTKDDIIKNYSDIYLDKAYEYFKDNEKIFNDIYLRNRKRKFLNENIYRDSEYFQRKRTIKDNISRVYYNYIKEKWLNRFKHNIVFKTINFVEDLVIDYSDNFPIDFQKDTTTYVTKKIPHSEVYVLKFNDEIKEDLLSKNSIYDYYFPKSLEDISFLKDNSYWLYSVTHEEICDIYCEDEQEFKYLKSLGIEFEDDKFEKTAHFEKINI